MRVILIVALILVAVSRYAWFVRPTDEPDLAAAGAAEARLTLAGATDCAVPQSFEEREQTRDHGTD